MSENEKTIQNPGTPEENVENAPIANEVDKENEAAAQQVIEETATEAKEEALAPEAKEEAPAPEAKEEESAPEAKEEAPAPEVKEEAKVEPKAEEEVKSEKEEEKIPVPNYHEMGKEDLVAAMRAILENSRLNAHKEVSLIKQTMYNIRQKETEEELQKFLDAGNEPAAFSAMPCEYEAQFKELYNEFKE